MADFTILHRDDLERSGRWLLARRSLGLRSFGMNLVEIEPGGGIPEHDELERDQEEIFIVLEGDAIVVLDGSSTPLRQARSSASTRGRSAASSTEPNGRLSS
jgi:uncharacterized cupin superfamily protein